MSSSSTSAIDMKPEHHREGNEADLPMDIWIRGRASVAGLPPGREDRVEEMRENKSI